MFYQFYLCPALYQMCFEQLRASHSEWMFANCQYTPSPYKGELHTCTNGAEQIEQLVATWRIGAVPGSALELNCGQVDL